MKPDTPCAKCGSTDIIPKARMIDGRDYSLAPSTNLEVGVKTKPYAFVFTGEKRSEVVARICGKCGYMELFADSPGVLWGAHVESLNRK